jgi:hypothetical protein
MAGDGTVDQEMCQQIQVARIEPRLASANWIEIQSAVVKTDHLEMQAPFQPRQAAREAEKAGK